jgi:hypothetical protein
MAIRGEFDNQAQPLKAKATEAFATAVSKSQELDFFSDCTRESLKMLRGTYAPEQFPEVQEERVALTKGAELAIGGDLLASIQDVPPPPVEDEPAVAAKREELQEDVTDLARKLREQTATDVRSGTPAQDGSSTKKPASDDQEPEDFL